MCFLSFLIYDFVVTEDVTEASTKSQTGMN